MPAQLPNDFASLCSHLQSFSGDVTRMAANTDGQTREVVMSLLGTWDQHFAQLQTAYPAAVQDIDTNIAATQSQTDSLKTKVADAKQQVSKAKEAQAAAAKAKKAGKKVPPLKPIDPKIGVSLRDELLERFGVKLDEPHQSPGQGPGEIWEGWEFEPWDQK